MTSPRKSRLDGSKQQQGTHRRYKLPRLTETMTCQGAFRAIARGCLNDLVANQEATCEGDREALHQMRIALTRLRAARSFFSSFITSSEWSRLKAELKWLNKHLSRARDLDVALKRLPSVEDPRPQATSTGHIWRKTWEISHRKLRRALHSKRYQILLHDTSIWIENGNRSPGGPKPSSKAQTSSLRTYSVRQLDRWCKKLLREGRTVKDMNASQRHRLRIKSKRLRYALEFFGPLLPSNTLTRVKALLKSLRKIQQCLGQLNDAEQGRSIASTLANSEKLSRDVVARWHSPFSTGRKAEKRIIKTAALTFREMAELKPF